MAGLVPAIHVCRFESVRTKDIDARQKAGHDGPILCSVGSGVLDILALFGYRRAPRRSARPGNGRWQEDSSPGGSVRRARGESKPAADRRRKPAERPRARVDPERAYLAAHGLEKSYGGRRVVSGVSLYVRRGEAGGLLGPHGAGKTTAFYTITGLIKPERGQVEIDGHDVTHLPMYQRARLGIGYL